jgi:hypothetical protein
MTSQEKHKAFTDEIARIESLYRHKLSFPISHYFEWRAHPYNLVYDSSKELDEEIKATVFAKYKAIFS